MSDYKFKSELTSEFGFINKVDYQIADNESEKDKCFVTIAIPTTQDKQYMYIRCLVDHENESLKQLLYYLDVTQDRDKETGRSKNFLTKHKCKVTIVNLRLSSEIIEGKAVVRASGILKSISF